MSIPTLLSDGSPAITCRGGWRGRLGGWVGVGRDGWIASWSTIARADPYWFSLCLKLITPGDFLLSRQPSPVATKEMGRVLLRVLIAFMV